MHICYSINEIYTILKQILKAYHNGKIWLIINDSKWYFLGVAVVLYAGSAICEVQDMREERLKKKYKYATDVHYGLKWTELNWTEVYRQGCILINVVKALAINSVNTRLHDSW